MRGYKQNLIGIVFALLAGTQIVTEAGTTTHFQAGTGGWNMGTLAVGADR